MLARESKTLNRLTKDRYQLSAKVFQRDEKIGLITSNITSHSSWVFDNIYQYPYEATSSKQTIARRHHGIQHASRVACWIFLLVNLYRRYGDEDARNLTPEDIELLRIAALFHDTARKNDGEDIWDRDSALLFYFYAHFVLNVPAATAKRFAEAIANKDAEGENWFELDITNPLEPVWSRASPAPSTKNILQKILHDADALDIIRVKYPFKANMLDIYKEHILNKEPHRLNELAHVWMQVRNIIKTQGDARKCQDDQQRLVYNTRNALYECVQSISPTNHSIAYPYCRALLTPEELKKPIVKTYQYDDKNPTSEESMNALLEQQALIFRGIPYPSGIRLKKKRVSLDRNYKEAEEAIHANETNAGTEIRKSGRVPGESSGSTKADHKNKNGNPNRSGTVIGYGAYVFDSVGLIAVDAAKHIKYVSTYDFGSSTGKKKHLYQHADDKVTAKELEKLKEKSKLGGDCNPHNDNIEVNEIVFDAFAKNYMAIGFTKGPTYCRPNPAVRHPLAPEILALYVQQEFKLRENRSLPIYEYKEDKSELKLCVYTEEQIIELWSKICGDYIRKHLLMPYSTTPYSSTLDEIKISGVYGTEYDYQFSKKLMPADLNYPDDLRAKIAKRLDEERQQLIIEHEDKILAQIQKKEIDHNSSEVRYNFLRSDRLTEACKPIIQDSIHNELKSHAFSDVDFLKCNWIRNNDRCKDDNSIQAQLFRLAKKSNLTNEANELKKAAVAKLKTESYRVTQCLYSKTEHDRGNIVVDIVNFATTFDLHSECKQEVANVIERSINLTVNTENFNDPGLIEYLHKLNLVNSNVLRMLQQVIERIENQIHYRYHDDSVSQPALISNYLLLAKVLNIPSATVKQKFIQFMQLDRNDTWHITGVIFKHCEIIKHLASHNLLNDSDIFNLICSKMRFTSPERNPYCSSIYSVECLTPFLYAFKKLSPDYCLGQDQLLIISRNISRLMFDYMRKDGSWAHFSNLARIIINFFEKIATDYPIPPPHDAIAHLKQLYQGLNEDDKRRYRDTIEDLTNLGIQLDTPPVSMLSTAEISNKLEASGVVESKGISQPLPGASPVNQGLQKHGLMPPVTHKQKLVYVSPAPDAKPGLRLTNF